jgi:hypothetical protein
MFWSMKKDRQLVELAGTNLIEKIAYKMDTSPSQIIKVARRLGGSLRPKPPKVVRKLKAKG